jgi:O-antigen ligase
VLLPWFVIAWGLIGQRWQRYAAPVILLIACAPIVYSLNRGLWIGLGLTVLYLCLRFILAGRITIPLMIIGGVVVGLGLVAVTPLGSTFESRLQHPHSNSIRASLSQQAYQAALASPLVGYGSTRATLGSSQSIGVGKSASCAACGNAAIGSNGQLWLLLIANGFLGAGLYFAFFIYSLWRYRRDMTPIGVAGTLVILLSFLYALVYTLSISTLTFYMLALGLMWRNEMAKRTPLEADTA